MLTTRGQKFPLKATLYISWVAAAGLTVFSAGMIRWHSTGWGRFLAFLFLAQIVSTQKISVPGMRGTMSPGFLFMLIGIADFSFAETLGLGCTAAFVQTLWKAKHLPKPEQVIFNTSTLVLCAGFSGWLGHKMFFATRATSPFVLIAIAAILFLVLNTALVSVVVSLTEQKPLQKEWLHCFYWSFPYFFVGALAAGSVSALGRLGGWPSGLLVLPLIYLYHLWYKVHVANATRQQALLEGLSENSRALLREEEPALVDM